MNAETATAQKPCLRILTWNVRKKEEQRELAVATIARIDADIICLQEPTESWQKDLCKWLRKRYPHNDFHIDYNRSGSGLSWFSKLPMNKGEFITSPAGWHGGWIKTFVTPLGRMQILGVHLRPPLDDNENFTLKAFFTSGNDRLREISEYMKHAKAGLPLIVLGDFNASDRSRSVRYVSQHGLQNALPQFSRFARTWRRPSCLFGISARLDHIFYTPDLHCRLARVVPVRPSDHQPVVAEFMLSEQ